MRAKNAETTFVITWPEMTNVLSFLIEECGAWFVPENNPEKPEPVCLRSVAEVVAHYLKVGYPEQLYVLSQAWSVAPLEFTELNSKGYHYF